MDIVMQKQFYPSHNVFGCRFQWCRGQLKIVI